VPYWWIVAAVATAFIAAGPIVAAVVATITGGGTARTAFASAPEGNYAVVARAEHDADVLVVVPADGGDPIEIGRVAHLPGYASYGAISPDGRHVALVVADGGTPTRPTASLVVVDLQSGKAEARAHGLDYLQTPTWSRDKSSIAVTRTSGGDGSRADVDILAVPANGGAERNLARAEAVLGAYPIAFDADGRLLYVAIDGRGSVLFRDDTQLAQLAPGITRDWRLSPDGLQLAFIETFTSGGVRYLPRTMDLAGGASALAQVAGDGPQALGAAWKPGGEPVFGREPAAPSISNFSQELTAGGFDVPLGFSTDGAALAVQHWTGTSFSEPGSGSFEIVASDGSRSPLSGYSRFFGWASR
jgi:hypothetical protein